MALLLILPALGDSAGRLYRQAQKAEREGKDFEAFVLYIRAAGLRPKATKYQAAVERLRVHASQTLASLDQLEQAITLDPGNDYLRAEADAREEAEADEADPEPPPSIAEVREAQQPAPPVALRPTPGRRSFNVKGDARAVFSQVLPAYGITVVFDSDFTPGAPVRFVMQDADFRDAVRGLMALTNTFLVPVNERAALVAADTQQKRTELEPMAATLIPIPQVMSVEEANEVGRAVQQALDIKRLSVDANRRQVFVRDTVSRVGLARLLYQDLSRTRGEVLIDVELASASRSSLTNLGLTVPTSFPVLNLFTIWNTQPAQPEAKNVARIGGGKTVLGVQIGDAAFQADWMRSHGQLLSRFQVRATDGLAASMHIGDKFPIVNAIFSPIAITDQIRELDRTGQLRQPFPSFTFEDLGLVLKVTPRVHTSQEISLNIEAEFRVLAGPVFNGIPVISTRKFTSSVRLREGEGSLVSGLAVIQTARNDSGLFGFARIPLLGRLLSRNTWQRDDSELILTITPRLTSLPPAEQFPQRSFYSGTESRPVAPI